MTSSLHQFRWYLAGVVSQFIPHGVNSVLFAWLVAVHLGETGARLGYAQMSAQLPGLIFILFGGLMADRFDRRKILIIFHCFASVPVFLLVLGIGFGWLSYATLIIYAFAAGTVNSFIQPARDSLLNQVAGGNLQRAVTLVMGLTFASQIVGFTIAGQADRVGPAPLLTIQGCLLLLGALVAVKLPSSSPIVREKSRGNLADIKDGLSLIFHSRRMAPVMILMFAVGIFYVGAFSVVNPIVVRDIYGGSAADIALSFVCFMIGTIFTTAIMMAIGGIEQQGKGLMLALIAGGGFLGLTNLQLPFYGYLLCIGLWGVCGGFAMSLGRVIVQETAPEGYRARALSVYSLGNLGGMPIGSALMGNLTVTIGPLQSYLVAVCCIVLTSVATWLVTDLSKVNRLVGEGAEA